MNSYDSNDNDASNERTAETQEDDAPHASSHEYDSREKVTATKAKGTAKKNKQYRAKKPKDMPRRPLSAYNIFFKEERARMLAEGGVTGETSSQGDKSKIGFEAMAKTIGKRWRESPPEMLESYKQQAKDDMERYRREMDEYHMELAKRSRIQREEAERQKQSLAFSAAQTQQERAPLMNTNWLGMQSQVPGINGLMPQQIAGDNQNQFSIDAFLQAQMLASGGNNVQFPNPSSLNIQQMLSQQLLSMQGGAGNPNPVNNTENPGLMQQQSQKTLAGQPYNSFANQLSLLQQQQQLLQLQQLQQSQGSGTSQNQGYGLFQGYGNHEQGGGMSGNFDL